MNHLSRVGRDILPISAVSAVGSAAHASAHSRSTRYAPDSLALRLTAFVYRLRDGLVTEVRAFEEATEALEAAGLSE